MEENRITKKVELQREQQNSFSIGPLLYVPKIVEQTLVVTQFFFPFLLNFGSSFSFCKDYLVVEKSCLPDSFFSGGWRQQWREEAAGNLWLACCLFLGVRSDDL